VLYGLLNRKEVPMFWKPRKSSLTIRAELHDRLARSCEPINGVDSEVLRVRSVPSAYTRQIGGKTKRERMSDVAR
jgi:hypothetical protein